VGQDELLYQDVSLFNWKLKDSTCSATITTTQRLVTRSATAPNPPPPPAPPSAQATTAPAPACIPGAPARIALRPRRAEIALGERACFEARVLDPTGCDVPDAKVAWSLEHGNAIKASLENGCLVAGDSSAESEGTFTIVARHVGLRATAEVVVTAASLPSLVAKRLKAGAIEGVHDRPPGARNDTPQAPTPSPISDSRVSISVHAEGRSSGNPDAYWLVLAAAVLAALVGAFWLVRRRPAPTPAEAPPNATRSLACPTCGAIYPEGHTYCGDDGSLLSRLPK
jgi:hypothetical protein